jgi:hypothetical protein
VHWQCRVARDTSNVAAAMPFCKGIDPNGHSNDGMQMTDQEMPGEQSVIAEKLSE